MKMKTLVIVSVKKCLDPFSGSGTTPNLTQTSALNLAYPPASIQRDLAANNDPGRDR